MKKKTQYCFYWTNCDRDNDCFNNEYCPVYKFNPGCKTTERRIIRNERVSRSTTRRLDFN